MNSEITIRHATSPADERAFIRFQWKIYTRYAYWVPPLLMDRKKLIDRKGNPFYRHARMELFLAERRGEIVGRIAAIVNDNHNREHKENIGFFGFFECVNDQAAANALLDAAREWLQAQGVTAMRGPASPSVNDEYGLLVDGFDRMPYILMSYNPRYYMRLLETYGLRKIKDMFAYEVDHETSVGDRLQRISDTVKKRQGFTFRTLNMGDFDNEVKIIHDLYSRGWEHNWGEVPLTPEEFDYMAKDLKPVVDPRLIIIVELKGKPIGFALSLPNLNEILIHNRKGLLLPALARLLLFRKRVRSVRIIILGVLPEYQGTGAGAVLFYETSRRATENGYPHGEASWVLEDNVMMNRAAEFLNGTRTKTYRLYQLDFVKQ